MGRASTPGAKARTLDEVNSELADIAVQVRQDWIEHIELDPGMVQKLAPGVARSMLMAVSGRIADIGELSARRADVDFLRMNGASFNQVAMRLGWKDAELTHARDSLGLVYEMECVLQVHSGRELRFPQYPEPVSYVRITELGFELAYWSDDEWAQDPSEVMGAILGCAMNGAGNVSERPDVASLVQAAAVATRETPAG